MKAQKDTSQMVNKVREQKLQSVHEVKTIKDKSRAELTNQRQQKEMELRARNKQIEMDRRNAAMKQNDFHRNKVVIARAQVNEQQDKIHREISDYEKEAQELERMEAELLRKLQETQQNERAAFGRLESAMVDASIPKKMRKNGGATESQSSITNQRQRSTDPTAAARRNQKSRELGDRTGTR